MIEAMKFTITEIESLYVTLKNLKIYLYLKFYNFFCKNPKRILAISIPITIKKKGITKYQYNTTGAQINPAQEMKSVTKTNNYNIAFHFEYLFYIS